MAPRMKKIRPAKKRIEVSVGESVRILRELRESKDGLTLEEILERYNALEIIKARLQRMQNNKQIVLRLERYFIAKPSLLYIAKTIALLKWVLLNRQSEFD